MSIDFGPLATVHIYKDMICAFHGIFHGSSPGSNPVLPCQIWGQVFALNIALVHSAVYTTTWL